MVSQQRDGGCHQADAGLAREGAGPAGLEAGACESLCSRLRYDEAIQLFQTLLQSDPKSTNLLLQLAETQRRKGDINLAIDTFRRASQSAPSDTKPLLQLGLLMDGTGRREQAKPIYEQILKN